MRFLKNKILKAQEALRRQREKQIVVPQPRKMERQSILIVKETELSWEKDKLHKADDQISAVEASNVDTYASHKNLSINYGKAILTFAASTLAIPYLEPLLHQHSHLTLTVFQKFATQNKSKIGGISSLRSLLLVSEADNEKVSACKRVLQGIGEVFIKYFSVNWIMTGRLTHKLIYLRFRAKMLRRVQNPESFTYIREKKPVKGQQRVN